MKKEILNANGLAINIYTQDFKNDYISLTDIAKYKSNEPNDVIRNWLRTRDTIEFLGLWESIHNSNFNPVEFDGFRKEVGANAFTLSPSQWINKTHAIGIVSKSGRYGGTFAHSDIALEFASWISAEFKLYLIQDYKRLKSDENSRLSLNWNLNREIAKINYKIHTEAKGNMRDEASLNESLVLANMESYNAILLEKQVGQKERMQELRRLARTQLVSLEKLNLGLLK
ncbi:KilA-N domain-containing protein [Actinobacillus pleuropneumoniae]|uniref:KilA-N domain-containing protein n=1 Tax=Actinobacillus pleuropneumoniae TaxID=715 RepID=UPI001F216154|nr:KilA-N domain-containing protein [Actinobacillus pleuropneumoniae]UKH16467.1 KilA-N domain-containing protein [Actinobacillus pleuropneumoniae]